MGWNEGYEKIDIKQTLKFMSLFLCHIQTLGIYNNGRVFNYYFWSGIMGGFLSIYLGIDSIRASVIDDEGIELGSIKREAQIILKKECVEQSIEQLFADTVDIIKQIAIDYEYANISSMAITQDMGSFVCIDSLGEPILNAIMSCDRRARYQIRLCQKSYHKYKDECILPWSYSIIPKLIWIKNNMPDAYRKIFKVLTIDGFIAYRLCGETAIDNYSALLMAYNRKTSGYNIRLINDVGLNESILPTVSKIGECIGVISGKMKEELGFKEDIKFMLGSNTFILSSLSSFLYAEDNGDLKIMAYNMESSTLCTLNRYVKIKKDDGIIRLPHKGGLYIYGYIGDYCIRFSEWILKSFKLEAEEYIDISEGSNGVMVLPYVMGEGYNQGSDVKGGIIGIECTSSSSNILAAYFEAEGFMIKDKIDSMNYQGINTDRIYITKSIENEMFYNIISDITCKEVIVNNKYSHQMALFDLIFNKSSLDKDDVDIIKPDEIKSAEYNKLYNLHKNLLYRPLIDVYKYRKKALDKM